MLNTLAAIHRDKENCSILVLSFDPFYVHTLHSMNSVCIVYLWLNVIDEYICGRKNYQKFKMEKGVILLWFILCYDKMTIYCCFPLEIDVHMQTLNELKGQSSRRI